MAQSLAAIYVHYIWSTKHRYPFLTPAVLKSMHAYTATVVVNLNCPVLEVGGVADHIHILCLQCKHLTIPAFVEEVKKPTSKWAKTQRSRDPMLAKFMWQSGYAAFSVSASQVEDISHYIRDQEQHHRRTSFQDELRTLLKRYRVDFDEKYIWD